MADVDIFMTVPAIEHKVTPGGTPTINVTFEVTNNGHRLIEDNELLIDIYAVSSEQAGSEANVNFPMNALGVGATERQAGLVQVDAGTWTVTVYVIDVATGGLVNSSEPQSTTVAEVPTDERVRTQNAGYSVFPTITSIEKLTASTIRIHYDLVNSGVVDVPPGLTVSAYVDDEIKYLDSDQTYQLQRAVAVGRSEPHALTFEGETDPGLTWTAIIWVDPTGPSSAFAAADVTWDDNGHASLVPR